MGELEDVRELSTLILDTITRELGVRRENLSLEVEQVVSGALFEMARRARRNRRPSEMSMKKVPKDGDDGE